MKTIKYQPGEHSHYSLHEGLKAADNLLRLVEDMVKRKQLNLMGTAIDFGLGTADMRTLEFTAAQYVGLVKKALAHAIRCAPDNPNNYNPIRKLG